jgi:hypothetical protein
LLAQRAIAVTCLILAGCSTSDTFIKLDDSGKPTSQTDAEALQRALSDCQAFAGLVKAERGFLFGGSYAKAALNNCMRGKGYVRS